VSTVQLDTGPPSTRVAAPWGTRSRVRRYPEAMTTTVILGEHPEVEALIARRRELGLDGRDEVWDGLYYVAPHAGIRHSLIQLRLGGLLDGFAAPLGLSVSVAFNLGVAKDYRIPDLGVHRGSPTDLYVPTAAMVVEVLSADDKTFEKFDFYAAHHVEEILVVDPDQRTIRVWVLDGPRGEYRESSDSALLQVAAVRLESMITWP
jgi:Putative restriction endonuclease